MTPMLCSSGDLIADRRADYAALLAGAGDLPAACDLMADALALVPGWVAGWFRLGDLAEDAGQRDRARAAFARAQALDPADALGATLRLDLLRDVALVETMPPAFVEALFDQYAPDFDAALVDRLDYRAPQLLAAALPGTYARTLDLGCGTGLMGAELRPRCGWLEGWDISDQMLAQARDKALYDALDKRDLTTLAPAPDRYDLIVAADVFAYLGALEQIIGWAVGALAPGGTLAFTVEVDDGPHPMILRPSRRYAHSAGYIASLLAAAGLSAGRLDRATLRLDRGAPIEGLVVTATQPALTREGEADLENA